MTVIFACILLNYLLQMLTKLLIAVLLVDTDVVRDAQDTTIPTICTQIKQMEQWLSSFKAWTRLCPDPACGRQKACGSTMQTAKLV